MSNPAVRGTIEVHLHNVGQLLDTLDPSPFREKDLDPKADEFIVEERPGTLLGPAARNLCCTWISRRTIPPPGPPKPSAS